ncbi:MAG: ankyrin repeat protein [Gammaproteobacteria bacterium]
MSKELETFMRAFRTGNIEKLSRAIDKDLDVDSRDENKLAGLIWAGRKGKIESAKLLLAAGA